MKRKKYHYEFFLYTDNLCWGRILLGKGLTREEAIRNARPGNYGCTVVEKHRVYN